MNAGMHPPALVLNADFRPLSYFPLSLWSWQDSVKAVFLERVTIISEYEEQVSSPSMQMKLPSVIALKEYIPQSRHPALPVLMCFCAINLPVNIVIPDCQPAI